MRRMIAAFIVPMALVMSACGANVTAGTVVNKEFTEAYQTEEEIMEEECTVDYDTVTTGTGKNKKTKKVRDDDCEEVGTGEYETIDHPAVYTLTLEDKDAETGEVEVSEAEYNSVDEGDFFDADK